MDEFVGFKSCLTQQKFSRTHTRSYTCRVRRNLAIKSHFYFGQGSRNWSTSISATSVFPAHIHTCRCRTRIPAATCGGGQHSPLLQHFCNGNGKCSIGWATTSALWPKNHGAKVPHANAVPSILCSVYRLGLCPQLANNSLTQWSVKLIVAAAQLLQPSPQSRRHELGLPFHCPFFMLRFSVLSIWRLYWFHAMSVCSFIFRLHLLGVKSEFKLLTKVDIYLVRKKPQTLTG